MAFVSERIKEEDKEYFNSIGFTTLAGENPVRPFWWIIDREKEIIMTGRGKVFAEPTRGFQIYYKKELINIEYVDRGSGSYYEKNLITHYIIQRIEIPRKLIEKGVTIEEVKKIIIDILMVAGTFGMEPEATIETTITIEKEPIVI